MKYKSYWYEYHDPANWDGVKAMRKTLLRHYNSYKGIQATVNTHLDPNEHDGWHECIIEAIFEARNIKEAKQTINAFNLYDESSGVFTCFKKSNDKWIKAFTEEDMEE